MIELAIFASWVALWSRPRWNSLNKAGVLILLLMIPSALLVFAFAPDWFRTTLYVWTGYLAALLVVGSLVIQIRIGSEGILANQVGDPAGDLAPLLLKPLGMVARLFAVLGALSFFVGSLIGGNLRVALTFALITVLGPIVTFGYAWCAAWVADMLTRPDRH